MSKTFFPAALMALLLSPAAHAGSFDVSTLTCADISSMSGDVLNKMLFWIDGYMGGAAEDSTYDDERLQSNIDAALALCKESPDAKLMEVLNSAENG